MLDFLTFKNNKSLETWKEIKPDWKRHWIRNQSAIKYLFIYYNVVTECQNCQLYNVSFEERQQEIGIRTKRESMDERKQKVIIKENQREYIVN